MRMPPTTLALSITLLLALPACGGGQGIGLPIGLPPTITSVSPNAGPTTGGGIIGITGTNFTSLMSVSVGGNLCFNTTATSTTTMSCQVPGGTAGARDVQVSTVTGSDTLVGGYTYVAVPALRLSPGKGPVVEITYLDEAGTPLGQLFDPVHLAVTPEQSLGDLPASAFTPLLAGHVFPDLHEAGGFYFGLESRSGTVFWYLDPTDLAQGEFPDGWYLDPAMRGATSIEVSLR